MTGVGSGCLKTECWGAETCFSRTIPYWNGDWFEMEFLRSQPETAVFHFRDCVRQSWNTLGSIGIQEIVSSETPNHNTEGCDGISPPLKCSLIPSAPNHSVISSDSPNVFPAFDQFFDFFNLQSMLTLTNSRFAGWSSLMTAAVTSGPGY